MGHTITFQPSGKRVFTKDTQTILDLAREAGISMESICGGKGICGKCKVVLNKTDAPLPSPTKREYEVLGDLLENGCRLACEVVPGGDITVHIPEQSRAAGQVILTAARYSPTRLCPMVENIFIETPAPTLDSPLADAERIMHSITEARGIRRITFDPMISRKVPHAVRKDNGRVTVALWNGREVVDVRPGMQEDIYGIAFDIGTTTVVAYLLDLHRGVEISVKAVMNPQVVYGDNVVSRISHCMEHPDGLDKLRSVLLGCMNGLIEELCEETGIKSDRIMEAAVAGNTLMHHIFLGLDPQYLALAPYCPVIQSCHHIKARDLYLKLSPSAQVYILPVKAGFVGGDTIGAVIATRPHKRYSTTLLIDLGTNGEIVLGNRHRLLCCSTAAGPAFEGGHIRWGMRATSGAVEKVRMDAETFSVVLKTIGNCPPLGICGSGLISSIAELVKTGMLTRKGVFNTRQFSPRLREGSEGFEFVLAWAGETGTNSDLVITQQDVAELQLAKAAIHAGITILMKRMGLKSIDTILLAGAFGTFIKAEDACLVGLLPNCLSSKIESVGNAAGAGSCIVLSNKYMKKEAERIARDMEYVELSADPDFQELFVEGMYFMQAAASLEDGL